MELNQSGSSFINQQLKFYLFLMKQKCFSFLLQCSLFSRDFQSNNQSYVLYLIRYESRLRKKPSRSDKRKTFCTLNNCLKYKSLECFVVTETYYRRVITNNNLLLRRPTRIQKMNCYGSRKNTNKLISLTLHFMVVYTVHLF